MKLKKLDFCLPSLGQSWVIVLVFIGGSLLAGLIVGLLQLVSPVDLTQCQSLSYFISMIFPFLFIYVCSSRAARVQSSPFENVQASCPVNSPAFGTLGAVGAFLLLALSMLAFTVVIEPTTSFIPMPDMIKDMFEKIFFQTALWDSILSTCILAPLLEELLCRGVIMRGMLQKMAPWKAILWSAFIFGVIHMNPWQSIPAFIIGAFFGWVYFRTHCLWATIFLHCLNNSLSTFIARMFPEIGVDEGLMDILPQPAYWLVYAGAFLVLAAVLVFLHKRLPQASLKTPGFAQQNATFSDTIGYNRINGTV